MSMCVMNKSPMFVYKSYETRLKSFYFQMVHYNIRIRAKHLNSSKILKMCIFNIIFNKINFSSLSIFLIIIKNKIIDVLNTTENI